MKLYYSPGACSLSPHIVSCELGFDLQMIKVDLATHTIEDGRDYHSVNPKGYVPALELDNGEILTEGVAIIQYLADQKPEKNLVPKWGTFERYRLQEWLTFISSELHKNFSPLWNKNLAEEVRKSTIEKLNKRFEYLEEKLSGQQFLMGGAFSVADAYCFTILRWSNVLNVDISAYANVMAYVERIAARPAVQEAMRAEGLLK